MTGSLTRSRMTANRLQIDQSLNALSDHEYKQLCRYARRLINAILPDGCDQAPEDFVQSAMQLTLSLNRKWNTAYPIRQHLFELIETEVMDYDRKLRGGNDVLIRSWIRRSPPPQTGMAIVMTMSLPGLRRR